MKKSSVIKKKLPFLMVLLLLIFCEKLAQSQNITPPMNIVPSEDVHHEEDAGYWDINGSSISDLDATVSVVDFDISPNGNIITTGNYKSYRGLRGPRLMVHEPNFDPTSDFNDFSTNTTIDNDSNGGVLALRSNDFLFVDWVSGVGSRDLYLFKSDDSRTKINQASWGPVIDIQDLREHPTEDNAVYVAIRTSTTAPNGHKIIKIDASDGTLDTGFSYSTTGGVIRKIDFNPDGNLVVSQDANGLKELNATTGAVLQTYSAYSTTGQSPYDFDFQTDGKIIIVGMDLPITNYKNIARLNKDGSLDTSFEENTVSRNSAPKSNHTTNNASFNGVAVDHHNNIYVIGRIDQLRDKYLVHQGIVKYEPDGVINEEFRRNVQDWGHFNDGHNDIDDIEVQPDGKIVVSGSFEGGNKLVHSALLRLHGNGLLDTELNNTTANLSTSSGLPETDPSIIAAATSTYEESGTTGITVLSGRTNRSHHAYTYRKGEEYFYNKPGYNPSFYSTTNDNELFGGNSNINPPPMRFDIGVGRFIVSYNGDDGPVCYSTYTGEVLWKKNYSTNALKQLWHSDISGDGHFYAHTENASQGSKIHILNMSDGSLYRTINVGTFVEDVAFTPNASHDYIYASVSGAVVRRYKLSDGSLDASIASSLWTGGRYTIEFYSATDFYMSYRVNSSATIYKMKITDAAGNLDPHGTKITKDTSFGDATDNKVSMTDHTWRVHANGRFNHSVETTDSEGNLYTVGSDSNQAGEKGGKNISRIGPVGIDIEPDYIITSTVNTQNNSALIDWGKYSSSLPIEMGGFLIYAIEADVRLEWKTLSETNNSHFEIERSVDGQNFDYLISVQSKAVNGNSSYAIQYNSTDKGVGELSKEVYYRIKQVDFDGSFSYTPIRYVHFDDLYFQTKVYPTPVNQGQNINIISSEISTVEVYDNLGSLVYIKREIGKPNSTSINTSQFAKGNYLVVINKKAVLKCIVQ